ncbi:MAG: dihydropteroate synthase, partial [bacterium]|nr:dihydropteroate synthase [bacterium]
MNFFERLKQPKPVILDGAMGTLLFREVPGYSGPFEMLNLENPAVIEKIHREYIDAGAEMIETNTFGGSRIKLTEYGLGDRCEEINEKAVLTARKAVDGRAVYIAGAIGPTGMLVEPMGDMPVEEIYESFAVQVRGLVKGGADALIIETMNDLQEAKLAVMAARDNSSLPVISSMTFEENAKTVTGTGMLTGFATLSEFGAHVVGANCSMGPDGLAALFKENLDDIKKTGMPLCVWSNAGLPELVNGKSVYTLSAKNFAETSMEFARFGVKIIGGCCGTTPEHIAALRQQVDNTNEFPVERHEKNYGFITSRSAAIDFNKQKDLIIIGERLNPTARKKFSADLKEGKQGFLREESKKQEAEGAHILDINVGVPGIDEIGAMYQSVSVLSTIVNTPLMLDSDNREVLEKALLAYPGVAILNSINGKEKSINTLVPIIKRFGCFIIALCLDDTGIHQDASKRIAVGERLIATLESEQIDPRRILIDPLMLAESAEPGSALETLKVIEHFAKKGIKTSLGVSNISYGLPQRKFINNVYLKMAAEKGLTAAIFNPSALRIIEGPLENLTGEDALAYDFLTGSDPGAAKYIDFFNQQKKQDGAAEAKPAPVKKSESPEETILASIYEGVIEGNGDEVAELAEKALASLPPESIMNEALLKALEKVGELYSTGEYFLPQMIASANAMKKGFLLLKPLLSAKATEELGTVVICTVKGDVHDIGKNIVAMMMENHGFTVHDLGKDVSGETIIAKVKEVNADLVCLSSLLTTTMGEMKVVSEALREEQLSAKLLIGGAVVNDDYAESIGAVYGKDAVDGVARAKEMLGVQ